MKSIKIVKKFFSKAEAVNAAAYQRSMAKKNNLVISKVEIIDAYELFKLNGWLKKTPFENIGYPAPGQFMVIVRYNYNVVAVKKTSTLNKKIVSAAKNNTAGKKFKVVRLNDAQKQVVSSSLLSFVSNITVPAYRFKYRITYSVGKMKYNSISFTPPTYVCQLAA